MACARMKCTGFCPLRNTQLDGKRGNVFYDLKVTSIIHDGSMLDGQPEISVIKGKKLLDHPVSLSICQEIAKRCEGEIRWQEEMRYHLDLFSHPDMRVDVMNIRAQWREGRDLLQDLQDIRDGVTVVHESDLNKAAAEQKRERRKTAAERRRKRLINTAKQNGLDSLTPYQAVNWPMKIWKKLKMISRISSSASFSICQIQLFVMLL